MRKSTQVVIVVVFVWVIGSHNVSSSAQKSVSAGEGEQVAATCVAEKFVMPSSVAVDNRAFSDYLKVASLPVDDRRTAFRGLSSEQKAAFFKVQFALQLVKRRDITKQQTDFLLDAISKTSADLYETNDPAKVRLSNEMGRTWKSGHSVFSHLEMPPTFLALCLSRRPKT